VQAGVASEIVLPATPEASCTLHGKNNESNSALRLFADGSGNVRFHAKPTDGIEGVSNMVLDCSAKDGSTTTANVEVTATKDVVVQARIDRFAAASKLYPVRPAITEKELSLSTAELVARGYGPVPDRTKAPDEFKAWFDAMSKPVVRIPDTHVLDTGDTRGGNSTAASGRGIKSSANARNSSNDPDAANNWCGIVLADAPAYSYVFGSWTVPSVDGFNDSSSTWIGLDGALGKQDLLQAGTAQDIAFETVNCGGFCTGGLLVATYYGWYEYLPANEQRIFDVAPGDSMVSAVYAGDANGLIESSGPYMWFTLQDTTSGAIQQKRVDKPSNAPAFSAWTAEWIEERPTVNKKLTTLADFHVATFTGGFSFDPNDQSFHTIDSDFRFDVTMQSTDATRTLATPWENSASQFGCTWVQRN
jgi:hypothetical protein